MSLIDRIVFEDVSVFFGGTPALRKFNVAIEPGVTVLRGPNGSGKSTVLRLLSGALRATRGKIDFWAGDQRRQAPLASVLGHDAGLYPDLSARENLALFATYWGADATDIEPLIERFGLRSFCDRAVRGFSQGQRQRTAIARAALANAPLLLLDEPTTGLDDEARRTLHAYIQESRTKSRFVLWVTHERFAEVTADRELQLERGRLRSDGGEEG